jgi:hypothetical protein
MYIEIIQYKEINLSRLNVNIMEYSSEILLFKINSELQTT